MYIYIYLQLREETSKSRCVFRPRPEKFHTVSNDHGRT